MDLNPSSFTPSRNHFSIFLMSFQPFEFFTKHKEIINLSKKNLPDSFQKVLKRVNWLNKSDNYKKAHNHTFYARNHDLDNYHL